MAAPRKPTRAQEHRALLAAHRHHYENLLAFQGGVCAIPACGRPPSASRRLDLDHSHKDMLVRGLLCVRCNRALPDWLTPQHLRDFADYLENPPYPRFLAMLAQV